VSLEEGEIQGFNHLDHADKLRVDKTVKDVSAGDYDGILIPGGVASGDFLRADEDAVKLVAAFAEQHKPIASICHGPWILVEAGIVKGRTVTSWPSLQTDIRNAGGTWVDEEVHVDHGLVTSRKPDDIPAFSAKAVEEFAEGRHEDMPQPSGTAAA
jgi:protease I